ncbi:MAG: hypothetical protein ACRDRA_04310 [Pseudonocardiaceae bacterium]
MVSRSRNSAIPALVGRGCSAVFSDVVAEHVLVDAMVEADDATVVTSE